MNYNKKKYLFLTKWIKIILPIFDFFIICYIKPLNARNSFALKKNFKIVSSSILKGSQFFNEISTLSVFSGKLAIVYFNNNDLVEIRQFLNIVDEQKILVPLLYYNSNRFIETSAALIKNQLKKYNYIRNLKKKQIMLSSNICFVNFSYQKMLTFHQQRIYLYLMMANEK